MLIFNLENPKNTPIISHKESGLIRSLYLIKPTFYPVIFVQLTYH